MKTKLGAIVLGMFAAGVANAAGQTVPHVFQSGQRAVASEVNTNFQNLADRIEVGGELVSGSTYLSGGNVTSKVFQVSGSTGSCPVNTETRTYIVNGATTTETIDGNNGATNCTYSVETHVTDASGTKVTQIDSYDPTGTSITAVTHYHDGIRFLPALLHKHMAWALDTTVTRQPTGGADETGTFVGQYTAVGTASVTVPAGTFNNCIKITRNSYFSTNAIGTGTSFFRVDWRCQNVGLVKRLDSSGRKYELVSTTP